MYKNVPILDSDGYIYPYKSIPSSRLRKIRDITTNKMVYIKSNKPNLPANSPRLKSLRILVTMT